MSYVPSGLTTFHHSGRPRPDRGSLPATYHGQRVVRGTERTYIVPRDRRSFIDPQTGASISTGKKSRGKVMVKYHKKRRSRRRMKIPRKIPSAPFPNKIVRRLKTSQFYDTGAHTSGVLDAFAWRLNDLADPEGSFGTQQALGFDQYSALYRKYCVIGAKIIIQAYNNDSNAFVIGTHINTDATSLTSYEHYKELKNTRSFVLSPDVDHMTWTHKISLPKVFKTKKLISNEDHYGGKLAAHDDGLTTPNELAYVHLFAQPMNQLTTTTNGIYFSITMEQIVVFYDYETPARSVV